MRFLFLVEPVVCSAPFPPRGPFNFEGEFAMRKLRVALRVMLSIVCVGASSRAMAQETQAVSPESVVKVFATMRLPDMIRPWNKQSPQEATGTGIVIEGKRILTNAHVVLYATQLFVQSSGSGDKVAATVEAIAPGIDLALLKLEDESFFENRPALARATELPTIKSAVEVYGYPTGGTSLSITKGIVSRIDFATYHSQTSGLRIQIDAAINPGNSGGPAIVNEKMIGVAFSKLGGADNIGYIIPNEEVELFLKDVADGRYDGKPAMFDQLQTLENDALRAKLKLDRKAAGMVVHQPEKDDADYPLKKWDLITKLGDYNVDSTGMVKVNENLRLRFNYLIQNVARDGKLPMTLIRDGQELQVELPVRSSKEMLIGDLHGAYPSYFIYGPLVFSPVTAEFTSSFERAGPALSQILAAIGSPLVTRRGDTPKFEGEELVVVSSPMFPHKIGNGYSNPFSKVVDQVNGTEIKNLPHLIETLRDLKDEFVIIQFDDRGSETIVFNREEVVRAMDDILTDNGIRQQLSDDMKPFWEKKN
jgi:S1-C subfamily serine protease